MTSESAALAMQPAAARLQGWLALGVATLLTTIANFLFGVVVGQTGLSWAIFTSFHYLLAIALLAVAFLAYVRALAILALSVAYPIFTGLCLSLTTILTHSVLGDPLGIREWVGIALIFAGVARISSMERSVTA